MPQWWEADPVVSEPSMQPMVAHTPHAHGNWWEADPVADEPKPREVTNYRGLRIVKTGDKVEANPTPTDEENAEMLRQVGEYYPAMASLVSMGLGGGAAAAARPLAVRAIPYATGAALGGAEYAHSGDPLRAMGAAVTGFQGGKGAVGIGRGLLARLGAGAVAEAAVPAVAEAAAEAAPAAYRGIPSLMRIAPAAAEEAAAVTEGARATQSAGNLSSLLRPAASSAAPAVAETAPVVAEAAKAAATPAKTVVQFAKEIAKDNPKVGEKIWILLDDAGQPLKRLTPDQAAAAARKGLPTTWVKNLW